MQNLFMMIGHLDTAEDRTHATDDLFAEHFPAFLAQHTDISGVVRDW